jgi:NADH-quinone oxidoreductase subunit J
VDTKTTSDMILAFAVVVLGAIGTYLLLPHRHGRAKPRQVHIGGGVLVALAIVLFANFWTPPDELLTKLFFYAFGFAAIGGAVLTITSRNPIYSALWFAAVVLATSGLFLLAGAQFLAVGTVIVYAGAIIVTFLFVIMLAQMEGRAPYDRAARAPFRATISGFLLFWALLYSLFLIRPPEDRAAGTPPRGAAAGSRLPRTWELARLPHRMEDRGVAEVLRRASRETAQLNLPSGHRKPHVAGLGETLYTDYLITVELAGTLLFVALVGAILIAAPKAPIRPGTRPVEPIATV